MATTLADINATLGATNIGIAAVAKVMHEEDDEEILASEEGTIEENQENNNENQE